MSRRLQSYTELTRQLQQQPPPLPSPSLTPRQLESDPLSTSLILPLLPSHILLLSRSVCFVVPLCVVAWTAARSPPPSLRLRRRQQSKWNRAILITTQTPDTRVTHNTTHTWAAKAVKQEEESDRHSPTFVSFFPCQDSFTCIAVTCISHPSRTTS